MTTLESVKARIAKLLALTEARGASPAEAATAMRLAHEMMAAHRLAEAECHLPGAADDDAMAWQWDHAFDSGAHDSTSWRGIIAYAIGQVNGCASEWRRHPNAYRDATAPRTVHVVYFGRRADAETCAYMLALACSEVDRLARIHCKGRGRAFGGQYRLGCASAIASALREAHAADRARYAGDSRALAILDRFSEARARSGASSRKHRGGGRAGYAEGQRAGAGIALRHSGPRVSGGALRLGSGR